MAAYATALPLNAYWTGVARCLVSAFVIRSSACTINDILDRKFDAGVGELWSLICYSETVTDRILERTKNRSNVSAVCAPATY